MNKIKIVSTIFLMSLVLYSCSPVHGVDLKLSRIIPIELGQFHFYVYDNHLVANTYTRVRAVTVWDLETGEEAEVFEDHYLRYLFTDQHIIVLGELPELNIVVYDYETGKFLDSYGLNRLSDIVSGHVNTLIASNLELNEATRIQLNLTDGITTLNSYYDETQSYDKQDDGSYFIPLREGKDAYLNLWLTEDYSAIDHYELVSLPNVGTLLFQLPGGHFATSYLSEQESPGIDMELFSPAILDSEGTIVKQFPEIIMDAGIEQQHGLPFQVTPDGKYLVYYSFGDQFSDEKGFRVMDIIY